MLTDVDSATMVGGKINLLLTSNEKRKKGAVLLFNLTLKDRADPDKVGLYQLFKKPGFRATRYRVKNRGLVRE